LLLFIAVHLIIRNKEKSITVWGGYPVFPADRVSQKVGIIILKKNYFPNFKKVVENNFSEFANFFQKSANSI